MVLNIVKPKAEYQGLAEQKGRPDNSYSKFTLSGCDNYLTNITPGVILLQTT